MENDPAKRPEKPFLQRWASRKAGGVASPGGRDDAGENDNAPAADDAPAGKEILTDADMPPIESLAEDSDFSGFLSPGVSEELRRRALRKLFASPGFNVRDGLDDYDDDFRNFAALGDLITSDMKHQMERAEERKAREQAAAETADEAADEAAEEAPEAGVDDEAAEDETAEGTPP